jgi:hypothetical protein
LVEKMKAFELRRRIWWYLDTRRFGSVQLRFRIRFERLCYL